MTGGTAVLIERFGPEQALELEGIVLYRAAPLRGASDLGVHRAEVLASSDLHEPGVGRPQLDRIAGLFSEPDRRRH